jgi:VWFA-related protein
VTAREVQLDLLVTDASGHPVTGLKPGDIMIEEDGVPQAIRSMDEHAPMLVAGPPTTNPTPPLPSNTFTNFAPVTNTNASTVLLLDALNSPIEAQMYLREQAIKYMKSVPPGTPIAIFQLDTQMRLIQGFTSDPETLRNAVASKRDMPKLSLLTDHNEVYRRYRSDILNAGLKEMGSYLAAYPGRKSLIWFTGSIPQNVYGSSSAFRDTMRYPDDANLVGADVSAEELASATDTLTLSRVAVYPIDDRGLQTDPRFDASSRHAGGSGTGFGVRQFYDHSALDNVAEATGGKAYYNTNGIKEAIAEIVNNGSYYYTIAYSTTNTKWDGAYRHIKVSTARGDLKLQYRRGYYAKSYEKREKRQLRAMEKRQASIPFDPDADAQPTQGAAIPKPKEGLPAAMALGAVPPTELIFNASLAPSSKVEKLEKNQPLPHDNYLRPDYQTKPYRDYNVLYLADAHKLKLTRTADGLRHGQVEFVAVVYGTGGEVVNSIQSNVEVTLNNGQYQQMLEHGFGMHQVVAIPVKGNYFLRLGLHDVAGDQVGALEIPVDEVRLGVAGAGQTLP